MHEVKKVVHLDIKASNVMLDEKLNIALTDFGCSSGEDVEDFKYMQCNKGTRPYMAPEIIEGDVFDGRKADIFSLGVLLFQIVIGRFPFSSAKETDKDYKFIIEDKLD